MRFSDAAQKYAKHFAFICCLKVCNKNALTFACAQIMRRVDNSANSRLRCQFATLPLAPFRFDGFFFVIAFHIA